MRQVVLKTFPLISRERNNNEERFEECFCFKEKNKGITSKF